MVVVGSHRFSIIYVLENTFSQNKKVDGAGFGEILGLISGVPRGVLFRCSVTIGRLEIIGFQQLVAPDPKPSK
jgi:hypothetical protein